MAWMINIYDLPSFTDYASAHKFWREAKPWKNSPDTNWRPLASRRKKHMNIRERADGAIACRLYGTDVVAFLPDESIEIQWYESQSTRRFASTLLPPDIDLIGVGRGLGTMLCLSRATPRFYRLPNFIRLRRSGESSWTIDPETPPPPFVWNSVDKSKTLPLLRATRYHDWMNWRAAFLKMTGDNWPMRRCFLDADILGWLAAPEKWEHLTKNVLPERVRSAIYRDRDVYRQESCPDADSWPQLRRIAEAQHRNG